MNKKMNNLNTKLELIARHVKIALTIAILCFSIGLVTAIPQQPYSLYGTATLNGNVLTAQDDDVISLEVVDGIELISYAMGDIAGTDNYVLKVPMDSDPGVTTAAQEGDTAYIYINGIAINEGAQIIGAPGTTVQFDISATSASNPPSVTVVSPNGGESIPVGTQVQVSAHATDDNSVTSVNFYYSNGSNWNSIGAGSRVSGTAKDGTWNKTWNTNGVSAGTNYLIKADASDGTSTDVDQSNSAFSLTSSSIIWQGDVTIIKGATFNVSAHNSGESYGLNRTTALGALDAAAEKGKFKYTVNDEWYASYGSLVVDSITDIPSEGLVGWMYWVNYPEDPMPMVGVNRYELEDGDVVTFYWSSSMDMTPADSPMLLIINVMVSSCVFDTNSPTHPYPSLSGTHTGTIIPSQDIPVQKLYTYPCAGTGGHTEYVRIYGNEIDKSAAWNGYGEDWSTLTFDSSFTLEAGKTYYYVIKTGSYPQIHHTSSLLTENGWLNCTKFVDADGKEYDNWVPAIRLWS